MGGNLSELVKNRRVNFITWVTLAHSIRRSKEHCEITNWAPKAYKGHCEVIANDRDWDIVARCNGTGPVTAWLDMEVNLTRRCELDRKDVQSGLHDYLV